MKAKIPPFTILIRRLYLLLLPFSMVISTSDIIYSRYDSL